MVWQITKILMMMLLWPIVLLLLGMYIIAKTCLDAMKCVQEDMTR